MTQETAKEKLAEQIYTARQVSWSGLPEQVKDIFRKDVQTILSNPLLVQEALGLLGGGEDTIGGGGGGAEGNKPFAIERWDLWNIMLPFVKEGSKYATTIQPLTPDFQKPPFYEHNKDEGYIRVVVNVDDPTSSKNTKYPRGELRGINADGSKVAFKIADGDYIVWGENYVEEMPKVVKGESIGYFTQFHGQDEEIMRGGRRDEDGAIFFANDRSGKEGKSEKRFFLKDESGNQLYVPRDLWFPWRAAIWTDERKVQLVAWHEGVMYSAEDDVADYWMKDTLYPKPGPLYLNVAEVGAGAGNEGTGRGIARARRIRRNR